MKQARRLPRDRHCEKKLSRSARRPGLNDGAGRLSTASGSHPHSEIHLAYDVDEDGKFDLTMTFQDGGGKWWLNRGTPGLLAFEGTKIECGTNTVRRQAMIDLDRDGKLDWLRGVPSPIIFERGDAKGGFVKSQEIPVGDSGRAEVLCLPIDIDGFIDLLVEWGHYGSPSSNSRIFRNDGKMNFMDLTEECGLALTGMSIKGAGEFNRDGFPDLFVLERKAPQIYLNDGLCFSDVDSDGALDIIGYTYIRNGRRDRRTTA